MGATRRAVLWRATLHGYQLLCRGWPGAHRSRCRHRIHQGSSHWGHPVRSGAMPSFSSDSNHRDNLYITRHFAPLFGSARGKTEDDRSETKNKRPFPASPREPATSRLWLKSTGLPGRGGPFRRKRSVSSWKRAFDVGGCLINPLMPSCEGTST